MKLSKLLFILFMFSLSPLSNAIGISSMIEVADKGKGSFTVTNTESYRQFLQVMISDISVINGELSMTPYTRDNINSWTLDIRPARTIIDPKISKEFKVSFKPKPNTLVDRDHAYQITFVPTPYFTKEDKVKHAMQIALGFAPIFIVPAVEDSPLNYEVVRSDELITVKNNGDTYIRAHINACSEDTKETDREDCSRLVYSLSGRELKIPLTFEMEKMKKIKIELSTHNSTYQDNFLISKGQTKHS